MTERGVYVFPASFAQRRLWSVEQSEATAGAYNVPFGLRFQGDLDPDHLAAALDHLEARHEILRTTLDMEQGELRQVVRPAGHFPLRRESLESAGDSAESALRLRLAAEQSAPFDLARGPLARAVLFRLAPRDHALAILTHHSIVDAWSLEIFVSELAAAYNAIRSGAIPELDPLPIQYADYTVWQVEGQNGEEMAGKLEYWRRELAGPLPVLELPTDHPRPPAQTYAGGRVRVEIGPEIAEPIRRLAQETNATMFMALLASFQAFLHRHTGQADLIVGTPITGRTRPETAGLIGFFLNMLAIRSDWSGASAFRELVSQARRKALAAYDAQDVPFEYLVDALRIPRDLSRHPIFQAVFVYQRAPGPVPEFSGASAERIPSVPSHRAKFDLLLSITDAGDRLDAEFEYNSNLFDPATAERMAERYRVLLRGIAGSPDGASAPLPEMPLLTPAEETELLETWNRTGTDYPGDRSVGALYEEQADRAPEAVALIAPGGKRERLTYRELDLRANRLAHHLRRRGAGPGSVVGVALDRSPEFVIAALATLKAGAAYVPLDPALPTDRLGKMLEDSGSRVVVTTGKRGAALPRGPVEPVFLDRAAAEIGREPESRLPMTAEPASPAYVMYTSGSTGQPKGVVVPHRAIVRLVRNTNYVSLSADDVVLACAPAAFDASTFEIWGSLLNGGRLVLYPEEVPNPTDIGELIAEHGVTTLWLTAGLFHLMAERNPEGFAGLRQLLAGGDVLSPSLVRKALASLRGGVLINGYGPTENTTFTCCHRIADPREIGETVPIGRPISNTRVYVLDRWMRPVPIGVRGELWAGGDGLALGYQNDPDLTAARFRSDPWSSDPGARIYRTGDTVRYRADGVLEFIGRSDTQIKIRGFRVEPGEIERTLCLHPGVADAVVIARERSSGDKQLQAYLVPVKGATPGTAELRSFVRQRLPEYAVPSAFVTLGAFPLTPNGKIDHGALPEPASERPRRASFPDALQTQLLLIWEQVLGVTGIGVDDNFFDLGGNSLRAVSMLGSVGRALGRRVPVSALYRGQTVASMALALKENAVDPSLRAIAIQPDGSGPVLFVVPGVDGDVIGYESLARELGPDQPLYALRSAGLDGESAPLEDVEAIAASLVPELQRVQPHGPYNLVGFCMGGIIAYEMARQLAAKGEKTEMLGLVDTGAPERIPDKQRRSRYGARLAFLFRGGSRHLRAMQEQPRGRRFSYILEKSRILLDMVRQRDVYRGDSYQLHHEMVTRANQRAAARYRPAGYEGGLLLILSNEVPIAPEQDPRLSWQRLARGESAVIRVTGKDSGSLLKAPYVHSLAGVLRRHLAGGGGEPA